VELTDRVGQLVKTSEPPKVTSVVMLFPIVWAVVVRLVIRYLGRVISAAADAIPAHVSEPQDIAFGAHDTVPEAATPAQVRAPHERALGAHDNVPEFVIERVPNAPHESAFTPQDIVPEESRDPHVTEPLKAAEFIVNEPPIMLPPKDMAGVGCVLSTRIALPLPIATEVVVGKFPIIRGDGVFTEAIAIISL
jgi:hypothetical protein